MTLEQAKSYEWRTYGKSGKDPLKIVRLGDCETDHLKNIIINIVNTGRGDIIPEYVQACKMILESRKVELPADLFEIS